MMNKELDQESQPLKLIENSHHSSSLFAFVMAKTGKSFSSALCD